MAQQGQKKEEVRLTPAEIQSRDLNDRIVACQTCDQLLGMLEQNLEAFTLINSVTAFYRFARVSSAATDGHAIGHVWDRTPGRVSVLQGTSGRCAL